MLAARDQLIALLASKQATGEQLQQARREFEVGTKTIIDTNEAQARFDQIEALEQVALGSLLVRRSELQVIIAREPDTLAPLRERPNLNPPMPPDINAWVRAAETGSLLVQIAHSGYEIATREIERQRDAYKPTVDLVSGYNINKFNGTQSSDLNPRINSGSVGVLLNVPIYTGGLIQSRVREALALQQRSNVDLESARRISRQRGARSLYRRQFWIDAGQRARIGRSVRAHATGIDTVGLRGRRAHSARRAERADATGADAARSKTGALRRLAGRFEVEGRRRHAG